MSTTVETSQGKRDRLWADATGPRSPRSRAYMRGVEAALDRRALGITISNPFQPGTADSDAWFAGADEGHWRWDTDETLREIRAVQALPGQH